MPKQKWSFAVRFFAALVLLFNLPGLIFPQVAYAKPLAVVTTPNPILFVTQIPVRSDFTTIGSVFGNHQTDVQGATRGGDLWIRYPDGTLKNLTQAAGFGSTGAITGGFQFQDHNAIAVRDPSVYWDGTKALFSMVIGSPEQQYVWGTYYWQIYEITDFVDPTHTPVITKVFKQPANFNNVSPIYGTDDHIIFTSDRPRNGAANLYPQLDEYEEAPTVTGLWNLDPVSGALFMMNQAPSGDFTPILDSFGRVIFTQWDHMQRDQQADADKYDGGSYGTFNWSDETATSIRLKSRGEIYPEPRVAQEAPANTNTFSFNQFFPWQIHEDGSAPETLNHIGRHELSGYFAKTFTNDPNLVECCAQARFNTNPINNLLQIKEDPTSPGKYYGIDAPEFRTHAAGQIVSLTAPPTLDADHVAVSYLTHRETASFTDTPTANTSGHYRDPLPLSDGTLIAAHTDEIDQEANSGPSTYDFRLKTLAVPVGKTFYEADQLLTSGISKSINYWDPDTNVTFSGNLWELQPVEVVARTRPTKLTTPLGTPEQQAFTQAGVNVAQLQNYMRQNNLALIVSHNVTTRDDFDLQQPFNLHIPNGVQTLGAGGKIYDIRFLQLFQADQLRGLGAKAGRRVLAELMHDPTAQILNSSVGSPASSVTLGTDGSMAAFVPARRAMTWQLTGPTGAPVVRERFWLTFQPGEIRVCASCHGVNDKDQAGHLPPVNKPLALVGLLQRWKKIITAPPALTLTSAPTADGLILESGENTSVGGTMNSTSDAFFVGDNAANRQYRGILHFNTAALPDTAVVTSVTIRLKLKGLVGTNPFTTHGGLVADIHQNFFGKTSALALSDFQAAANNMASATFGAAPVNGWYTATLSNASLPFINRIRQTQFRLRFTLDDNNDRGADFLAFFSGNAVVANRPQLVIQYYVP